MANPYGKGQKETMQSLDSWEELGWTSMQEMSKHMGHEILEELALAQERATNDDLSERSRHKWEEQVEFFKGMLSRLD